MTYWVTTSTSANSTIPLTFSVASWGVAIGGAGGVSGSQSVKPKLLSPLEWLAAEVEKTCALARATA